MNINTGKNTLIIEKIYTPLTISGNEISKISTNSACVLMNSNEANDIFTCIYSIEYPCAIGISSFSLDNDNMTELSSYSTLMSFTQQSYIIYYLYYYNNNIEIFILNYNRLNILKEKANEDKSKAYIVLITYEKARYSAIYDMNLNKISNIEKKVGEFCVGTDIRRFNFFYFKRTEQFVIFFRDNNINFRIIIMNKTYDAIYNESGDIILSYNNYYSFNRISIIYLKNELRYFLLSDASISNEPDGIKIFSFNLTNNLTNNYNDYENDSNQANSYSIQEEERKEEEEEKNIEEEEKNGEKEEQNVEEEEKEKEKYVEKEEKNVVEDEKEQENEKNEEKEEKHGEKEKNEEEKEKHEEIGENEIQEIISKDEYNKCYSYTKESLKMNLCVKCNKDFGFYPVNYNNYNIYPNGYKECFNEKTKEINFFFNEEKKEYEPCFETCNTCNNGGNEEINNCTSCDIDSIFKPEDINTTNCVKKCKYKYYYTSYGQYKCSENIFCPKEAKLYVRNKNKCIENCKFDNTYKYQYNGECLQKCPNGTYDENNICINANKNKCTYMKNKDYLMNSISSEDLDLLARTYANEYMYTNNHISIYKNSLYMISIYKNKECINDLSLTIHKIDFGTCYDDIKSDNRIDSELITLIMERYYNGSSIILYEFYNPITGDKINIYDNCKDVTITIQKNLIALLQGTEANIDFILKLTNQNIDIFDKYSEFYNDICFNYESPNGKDIPLKDRLIEFYPNVTLCDSGCLFIGVNLTSMVSI